MIGIIGAMSIETEAIIRELQHAEECVVSGVRFVKGNWNGTEVVVATSGVGKVFAALCAEAMILKYQPDYIVNSGVAGALDPALHILNVVIGEDVVQHDMDTSPLGDPKGLLSGINKVELPADAKLNAAFEKAAASLGIPTLRGRVASGDQFIASDEQRVFIRTTFGAACCEMEGASIGQVCYVNGVPFTVLRAISDGAADDAKMDYPAFAAKAAEQSIKILKKAMEELR
ncbi:MAG: 5'-methylthioadenosine/adenosylhomocysteine nucleosidase [Clostridia bacterium]|nr:5'-methylthioadenosine/adenosylhomocysteine nucleosidase [Clostridia bacterium]